MGALPGRTPLVGRTEELAALLRMCNGDAGGIAMVTGDAGIGKTRLLDELGTRVEATGALVLRGHAVPGGGAFRPLAQALVRAAPPSVADEVSAPFRGVLGRLLPAWPAPGPATQHLVDPVVVLGEAVLELLRVVSERRRCLLLLDDMHWADRDTLALLEYLAGGLAELPVQVVVAARDGEGADDLAALRRSALVAPLPPLGDEHVAVLARRCAGVEVSAEVLAFLVTAVDGLPLLVEELFAGLVETGRVRRGPRGWHSAGALTVAVPGAFARLVRHRIEAIPESAREVVRTAAVVGGEVDWRLVRVATGLGDDEVAAGLRAAVQASLLVVNGTDGALRWRHALTRDAVLDGLTAPERAGLCRRAAEALSADRVGLHGDRLALAADLHARSGSPLRAAGLLLRLARETIAAGALTAAEDVLHTAAGLAAGDPEMRGEITVEHVRALALGARTDEAIALGDAELPTVPAARRDLAVQLARACVAAERWAAAQSYLDLADATGDPAALALAAHVALGVDERDEALRLAAAAVTAGERSGVPDAVCEALEVTGQALRRADPPASEAAFADAERLAVAHGLTPRRIRALAEVGTHDILGTRGTARLEKARLLALECGMLGTATVLDLQITAGTSSSDGHVVAMPIALRCAEQSKRLRLPGPRAHALMFVARGSFWADRAGEVGALLDEAERIAPNPVNAMTTRDSLRGYSAWLDHDEVAGAAGLGAAVAHLRKSPVSNPAPLWGHWVLLATVAKPCDDDPRDELRGSDLLVQSGNRGALSYADAVTAMRAGHLDRACLLLAEGDAALAGKEYERLILRCILVSAVVPGGPAAGLADPEPWLREAVARWEPAGEVRLARWCRERLRMLGLAVPRPGRDRTAVPARLRALGITGRELDVLRLVAEGMSNAAVAARLNVSPRTVETHVGNLLTKTGATGRGALTGWA